MDEAPYPLPGARRRLPALSAHRSGLSYGPSWIAIFVRLPTLAFPLSRRAQSLFRLHRRRSSFCLKCLPLSTPAAFGFGYSALICLNAACPQNPSWCWTCGCHTFCRLLWPSVFAWLRSSSVKLSLMPAWTLSLLVLEVWSWRFCPLPCRPGIILPACVLFCRPCQPVPLAVACLRATAFHPLLGATRSAGPAVASALPAAHSPVPFSLKCDNASCDSASWKGISMARGLCHVLSCFCLRQRFWHISVHIDHVAEFRNTTADRLSRLSSPASLGFLESMHAVPPWPCLLALPSPSSYPASVDLTRFVSALS